MKHTYWLPEPEEHDYPAAATYLSLVCDHSLILMENLQHASIFNFKAKDIFRASKLSLLGISNSHVLKNLKKIHDRVHLSPLLLVRDATTRSVIIVDGYHRLCAVYHHDEDAMIPCKIVTL